ncbi:MAG: hypothetical protein AAGI38_04045 [Bacteroidota bacterium]
MKKIHLSVLCLCIVMLPFRVLLGQVTVRCWAPMNQQFNPSNFWQVFLTSTGFQGKGYLHGMLLDEEGHLVFEAKTAPFDIKNGEQRLMGTEVQVVSSNGELNPPAGNYQLCIEVYDVRNQQLLGNQCHFRQLIGGIGGGQSSGKTRQNPVQFSGNLSVEGLLSNQLMVFQEVPPNYLRVSGQQQLEVYGIPVQSQVYVTTEHRATTRPLNTLQLRMDTETFRKNLRAKVEEQVKAYDSPLDSKWLNPETLKNLDALKEKRLTDYQEKLKQKFPGYDSLLSVDQWRQKQAWLRTQATLDNPVFKDAISQYEQKLGSYGVDPDSVGQVDFLMDSLKQADPKSYQRLVRTRQLYEQATSLRSKFQDSLAVNQLPKTDEYMKERQRLDQLRQGGYAKLLEERKDFEATGLVSRFKSILMMVERFNVGTFYADHNPNALAGIAADGVDIALTPGPVYLRYSQGRIRPAMFGIDSSEALPKRNLIAAQAGVGKPQESHLLLGYVRIAEKGISGREELSYAPPVNTIWSAQGQLHLLEKKLTLRGDYSRSFLEGVISERQRSSLDSLGKPVLLPIDSAGNGEAYSFAGELKLFKGKTQLLGSYNKVSADYYSLGNPLLIRGNTQYEGRIRQGLWKNQLHVNLFLRRGLQVVSQLQGTEQALTYAGVTAELRLKKLPYVVATYAPFSQETKGGELNQGIQQAMYSLQTGHSFRWSNVVLSTTLNGTHQVSEAELAGSKFEGSIATFNQVLNYKGKMSFFSTQTLQVFQAQAVNQTTQGIEGGLQFNLGQKWQQMTGASYFSVNTGEIRRGLFSSSVFSISSKIQGELRLNYTSFAPFTAEVGQYEEYRGQLVLMYQW